MKTTLDNKKLLALVTGARTGTTVLPRFQRNFVWSRDDITDLLISILQRYFVGSFLLLGTDSDSIPFAMRAIEGVDLHQERLKPEWMILDGQQRLTSLHYVFAAPPISLRYTRYPYRFFLDLDKLTAGDVEEAVWSERADNLQDWDKREKQYAERTIPFTEIEKWDDWLYGYEDWLHDRGGEYYDAYRKSHRAQWREMIESIRNYEVPTIQIPKIDPNNPDHVAEVCAIFEKMNSTGVRLSVYDLLTARLYRDKIDLHALWEESVSRHELLNQYTDGKPDSYGVYLLRIVALLRGLDMKSKTLINLAPDDFEQDWRRAAHYAEAAFKRMTSTNADGFGVFDPKWQPYSTMIAPMAALLAQIDAEQMGHRAYKLLRKWYWASVFRERYAGSVESTTYRDYQDLLAVMRGEPRVPAVFADADAAILDNPRFSLIDVHRVNSIYRGVMCLVALKGAKDFQADDSIEFHTLDDHHIFPKAFLAKQNNNGAEGYDSALINSVVNRTLIAAGTNRRISRMAPSRYFTEIIPDDRRTYIFASHYIEQAAAEALAQDDFEAFLMHREESLIAAIRDQLRIDDPVVQKAYANNSHGEVDS